MARESYERAADAAVVVENYRETQAQASGNERYAEEPDETVVGDLLADLAYMCAAEGLDFGALVERAQMNFAAETGR